MERTTIDRIPEPTIGCGRRNDHEECRARRRIMHRFARHEFEALTRRAIHRLGRRKASGIFGNPEHGTLWDEFRHDRNTGPHPLLEVAFDDIVDDVVSGLVGTVPAHAATLLCEYASWMEGTDWEEALTDGADAPAMGAHLRSLVNVAALD